MVDAGVDEGVEPPDGGVCVLGSADPLDAEGFDANCDGVDGILEEQVYVSVEGVFGNSGLTPDAPVPYLGSALLIANSARRSVILVGAGTFTDGSLDFRDLAHVIAGGYGAGFVGPRTTSTLNVVFSLMVAPGFPRTLERVEFHLEEWHTEAAIVVAPSAQLRVEDCTITTVAALAGTAGVDSTGRATTPGQPSGSRTAESPTGLVVSGAAPSTPATANYCGGPTQGGAGGASDLPGGNTIMGGVGGRPGANGTPGRPGVDGTQGAPGAPLVSISLMGDPSHMTFSPLNGASGGVGGPASGGGGGGGGATTGGATPGDCTGYLRVTFFPPGAGGGPGGMGGCAGLPGSGGQSGRPAVGIAVGAGGRLDLVRSTVQPGPGGAGGAGGRGGDGELGGAGGASIPACYLVVGGTTRILGGVGGVGGTGGNAGRGGDGGGGAGGPSVGVWLFPTAVLNQDASTITPGAGGAGGASPGGAAGGDGPDGASVDIYRQTTP